MFETFIASKVIGTFLTSIEDSFLKHAYFDWQKRLGGAVTSHARTYARSVPLVLPRVPPSCHLYTQRSHLVLFRYRNISKHHIVCLITVNQLLFPWEKISQGSGEYHHCKYFLPWTSHLMSLVYYCPDNLYLDHENMSQQIKPWIKFGLQYHIVYFKWTHDIITWRLPYHFKFYQADSFMWL